MPYREYFSRTDLNEGGDGFQLRAPDTGISKRSLQTIDWIILAVPVVILTVIALRTRRHVKSVSDFMTGGRVAGRYIVAVSDGVAAMGLITAIGMFEFMYHSGFAISHWGQIATPIMLIVTLSGFVIYRFRETRAMTLAQFFEVRYSRRFRVFAGILGWTAGMLNYGIFPGGGGAILRGVLRVARDSLTMGGSRICRPSCR